MKIKITFKDPDGVFECIREAVEATLPEGLSPHERNQLVESRHEETASRLRKWLKYGEYLTVEFDTDAGTAVVVPIGGVH